MKPSTWFTIGALENEVLAMSIDDTVPTESPYFAAIDLGSNSFHMLIVKVNDGVLETVDRVKDMVQLARGLQRTNTLSKESQTRALHCLSCFQERIREIPAHQIRAVGTKAMRSADNADDFLRKAEATLGLPIDIISGFEEARLVYLGVAHDISPDKGRPLIIDIGGGSTEFIIGNGKQPELMESLSIGCVTYSDNYFSDDAGNSLSIVTDKMINETYYATCLELELITRRYRKHGWDITVGSSGTMKAISELMPSDVVSGIITKEGLNELMDQLRQHGTLLKTEGISSQRLSVLPAGIVILAAIFDQLQLEQIHVAHSTLKEGLLYDTIGRLSATDMRDQTVQKLIDQYTIDRDQASRVDNTLKHFIRSLPKPVINGVKVHKIVRWAALLHEIGLSISHSGYHHHGAYLLKYSDMAGFSRFEQELLALFVGTHRRKIHEEKLTVLASETQQSLAVFFACLRLAVLLNHRREDGIDLPDIKLQDHTIILQFPNDWLASHPLTDRNLRREQHSLESLNIRFEFY
jgi:exopolyphosphatase/guanosine-5'-triphosphate,3'-diphosphate pyrophosphatase